MGNNNHHKIQSPEVIEEGKRLQLELKKKYKNYEMASEAFQINEINLSISKATIAQYCGGSIRIPDKKLFYITNILNISISKIRKDTNFCYYNYGKGISYRLLEILNVLKISKESLYEISGLNPYDVKRVLEGDFNIRKHDLEEILASINVDEKKFWEPINDIFNFDYIDYHTEETIDYVSNLHEKTNKLTEQFESYTTEFITYLHTPLTYHPNNKLEFENKILSFFNIFFDLCNGTINGKLSEQLKIEIIRKIVGNNNSLSDK